VIDERTNGWTECGAALRTLFIAWLGPTVSIDWLPAILAASFPPISRHYFRHTVFPPLFSLLPSYFPP